MTNTMIRVTRFDASGRVFHTCLTEPTVRVETSATTGGLAVDMPLRYWHIPAGGKVSIEHAEVVHAAE